ncbi:DUF4157 domain-containing protein [Calothrix anomala FACHB-343]|uniref:DUF4157 domain-containing protein n=3 Tax=Calotrichaceae TaxID=2661849 RepID=A0ABR8A8V6_9CYAN|nr:DUF4157 domain-containing protein [Calothrix parietina FACHB-288]MBD2224955.1 DUF4157 domain-containing protein [Calothrix anomala FACHB-343]
MDDFWVQRWEKRSHLGHNFANIPIHAPDKQVSAPIQPHLPPFQAKLTIGEPGDKYEQEADRVASQVVQQINTPSAAQSTQGQSVQRQEEPDEELETKPSISVLQRSPLPTQVQLEAMPEDEELQAKSILQRRGAQGGGEASTNLESTINTARGNGQPLDAGLQQSMGQAMGADFSGVKVHTDAQADQLNRSVQAKAFTTGQDVFFRQGEYNPGSRGGQELIAHELTHVVQQNGGAVMRSQLQKDTTLHLYRAEPSIKATIQQQKMSFSTATSSTPGTIVQCKVTIGSDKYESERGGRRLKFRLGRSLEMMFGKRAPDDVMEKIKGMVTDERNHIFDSDSAFLQYVVESYGQQLTQVGSTRRRGANSHWTTNPLGRAKFTTRVQQDLLVGEEEHRRHVIPSHTLGQAAAMSTSPLNDINDFNERWGGQSSDSEHDARNNSYNILHNNLHNLWVGKGGTNSAIGFIQSTMFGISDSIVNMADTYGNVDLQNVFRVMNDKAKPTFPAWKDFQTAWDLIIGVTTDLLQSVANNDGKVNVVDTADVFTDIANSCALDLPESAITPQAYQQQVITLFEAMHVERQHHAKDGVFDKFMNLGST